MEPAAHPDLTPLLGLLGTWRGEGNGEYPTIEPFAFVEEVRFAQDGRPFLLYEQRTWRDGSPSHGEVGYWRPVAGGRIELVLAHTTGVTEIAEGTIEEGRIEVACPAVAGATTAKEVTSIERWFVLEGDVLRYDLRMSAVGRPMGFHASAQLHRARRVD